MEVEFDPAVVEILKAHYVELEHKAQIGGSADHRLNDRKGKGEHGGETCRGSDADAEIAPLAFEHRTQIALGSPVVDRALRIDAAVQDRRMCRWNAYFGQPVMIDELLFKTDHGLIDQSLHARMGVETTNGDGFGLGWYGTNGGHPGRYRRAGRG